MKRLLTAIGITALSARSNLFSFVHIYLDLG